MKGCESQSDRGIEEHFCTEQVRLPVPEQTKLNQSV